MSMWDSVVNFLQEQFKPDEMMKVLKDAALENLPEIINLAEKAAKEVSKNAKNFLK